MALVELAVDGREQFLILDIPDRLAGRTSGHSGEIRDHLAESPLREGRAQLGQGIQPESLAARVFRAECQALPEAVALYAAGRA
jgi:hypothetical protein